jgi:RNA recognition motif. (a.k.a. RRM, RBD, or RNP domain)
MRPSFGFIVDEVARVLRWPFEGRCIQASEGVISFQQFSDSCAFDLPHQIRSPSPLLRLVVEHPARARHQISCIRGMQELRMNTKLYVGNLPYETTESDLQTLFEGTGQVSTVNIVRDRATGQARGFAFVEMSDTEGAQRAIAELDHHQIGGRSLTVNEAKPMAPRSGGGAGTRQRREPRW